MGASDYDWAVGLPTGVGLTALGGWAAARGGYDVFDGLWVVFVLILIFGFVGLLRGEFDAQKDGGPTFLWTSTTGFVGWAIVSMIVGVPRFGSD
jgi:hypothetical protein